MKLNDPEIIVERLFQTLVTGDRQSARTIVDETFAGGLPAEDIAHEIYWPLLQMISQLFRADQLSMLAHHFSTRMLRTLVDQLQMRYDQQMRRDRRILLFSGAGESDELTGLLVADLAEADGYEVAFGGGGIANDEILGEVGEKRPDILLMFASAPTDAPNIRQLIDTVRGVGACPDMQIVVGGGVFNRAEGLAEEIGADLWARTPRELLQRLHDEPTRRATAEQRTVGRNRRPLRAEVA